MTQNWPDRMEKFDGIQTICIRILDYQVFSVPRIFCSHCGRQQISDDPRWSKNRPFSLVGVLGQQLRSGSLDLQFFSGNFCVFCIEYFFDSQLVPKLISRNNSK